MPPELSKTLIQAIQKIPIFKGLSPTQTHKILHLCTPKTYQSGERVCTSDSPSDEMYILITGALAVMTADGLQVAALEPVTTVGEMGIITRHSRSATVEAIEPSHILTIQKSSFDLMLRDDLKMQGQIYRNIIEILAQKIVKDNVRTRVHLLMKVRQENRLKRQRRRAEIALDLLVRRGGWAARRPSCTSPRR